MKFSFDYGSEVEKDFFFSTSAEASVGEEEDKVLFFNKNMEKKITALLIIISLLIGFEIGTIFERGIWRWQSKLAQSREEIDLLKSQLEMLCPPLPEEIYGVYGTVTEVGDKFLVVETQIQVSRFPLPEGKDFETRNIRVNMDEETEIFQLGMPESPSLLEEPFKGTSLNLKDIKIGDYIMVSSKENIRDKKEITAKEIQVMKDKIYPPY